MRKYETVFISDPDLQDQTRTDLFDKTRNIITKENGIIIDFDDWGNKKLAFEIKKKSRGHYVCVTYGGTGELVAELERNFRLTDDVLKFMTIVLSGDLTTEQLEKEVQQAQEEKSEKGTTEEVAATEEVADKTQTKQTN
ncbi:MAG: 30S ribosomal protein S6 [Pseudomonadota bacterium]